MIVVEMTTQLNVSLYKNISFSLMSFFSKLIENVFLLSINCASLVSGSHLGGCDACQKIRRKIRKIRMIDEVNFITYFEDEVKFITYFEFKENFITEFENEVNKLIVSFNLGSLFIPNAYISMQFRVYQTPH